MYLNSTPHRKRPSLHQPYIRLIDLEPVPGELARLEHLFADCHLVERRVELARIAGVAS